MKIGEFIKVEASEFLGTDAGTFEVVDILELFEGRPVAVCKEIIDGEVGEFYVTLEAPHRVVTTVGHEVIDL